MNTLRLENLIERFGVLALFFLGICGFMYCVMNIIWGDRITGLIFIIPSWDVAIRYNEEWKEINWWHYKE